MAGLLGKDYSSAQMSYDLRRLRLHGMIQRTGHQLLPLTPDGHRVAVFYTKLYGPPAPPTTRRGPTPSATGATPRPGNNLRRIIDELVTNAGSTWG